MFPVLTSRRKFDRIRFSIYLEEPIFVLWPFLEWKTVTLWDGKKQSVVVKIFARGTLFTSSSSYPSLRKVVPKKKKDLRFWWVGPFFLLPFQINFCQKTTFSTQFHTKNRFFLSQKVLPFNQNWIKRTFSSVDFAEIVVLFFNRSSVALG